VIVVTHDSRITQYGDRTIEMADGRVTKITERSPASPLEERASP
jgi:ABC-type lipoprotein export system ATPase subunit